MNRVSNNRALAGIGILLSVCLFCGVASLAGIRVANELARIEVERAARQVGSEPTLDGIGEYIVKSIKPGMSREQVEKTLEAIGPLEIVRESLNESGLDEESIACDEISLKLSLLPGYNVWRMFACYNSKGGLVSLKSADPDGFPSLNIYAP